jgi:anthranilate phosphoribosyltransferase
VESAGRIQSILDGQPSPAASVVVANAAAALLATERVRSLREGVASATRAIAEGRARQVLDKLRVLSRENPEAVQAGTE